jgi:hypothetical protein
MSKARSSSVTNASSNSGMPDKATIERLYLEVLEHTLVPPTIRERLIESQSAERKWQFVQIHQQNTMSGGGSGGSGSASIGSSQNAANNKGNQWNERGNALLTKINTSKSPDIQSLLTLKVLLSSANKETMTSFLKADGVSILVKAVLTRTNHKSMDEVEAALLYEILLCCKLVLNNMMGMKGFLAVNGSIDAIALSLRFEYKHLALLVSLSLSLSLSLLCTVQTLTLSLSLSLFVFRCWRSFQLFAIQNHQPTWSFQACVS